MRIGFDGKRATQNFTGLGNYSRQTLAILTDFFPVNKYYVYALKALKPHYLEKFDYLKYLNFCFPKNKIFKKFWRSFGIKEDLKRDRIELYHGLSNEIPFGLKQAGIPSIVTIHDLIFLRYPHYYSFIDRKIYKYKFRYACKNADQIIAVSEQTKRDIISFFNIPAGRIQVIYQNCASIFKEEIGFKRKEEISKKYNLPKQYILNVGSIESRKNLLLIIKALKLVPEACHLVVVGKKTAYAEKVNEFIQVNGLTRRVHFLKEVTFEDLPGIYQQAEIFVYPSKFEGFGIPVLEALNSGIPVIAAKGSSLEEAGGSGSIYIESNNAVELSDRINQVLNSSELKSKMINDGNEHAKQFSDEQIAESLIHLYQKTIKNAKR